MRARFLFGVQTVKVGGDLVQADLYFNVPLMHGAKSLLIPLCVVVPFILFNTSLVKCHCGCY